MKTKPKGSSRRRGTRFLLRIVGDRLGRPVWQAELEYERRPTPRVDAFLRDVVKVYRKHGLSLYSITQQYSSLEVGPMQPYDYETVMNATVGPLVPLDRL